MNSDVGTSREPFCVWSPASAPDNVEFRPAWIERIELCDNCSRCQIVFARLDSSDRYNAQLATGDSLAVCLATRKIKDIAHAGPVERNCGIRADKRLEFSARLLGVDEKIAQACHRALERPRHIKLGLGAQILAAGHEKEIVHVERYAVAREDKQGRGRKTGKHKLGGWIEEGEQRQKDLLLDNHRQHAA